MTLTVGIVIPAYNRPRELGELLDSVLAQSRLPDSVLVCEDHSPMRLEVTELCESYKGVFSSRGIKLIYVENEINLGYDKNLRKSIEIADTDWVVVMGNDDLLLANAVEDVIKFISSNDVDFASRTFLRFTKSINAPLGTSSLSKLDSVFTQSNSSAGMVFRSAGFVGGLVIRTSFAKSISCSHFDGSLYYQIYLAANAYCGKGIGYISTPIVGGRADNPPMFGGAEDDGGVHIPGSYTAQGRARMWRGVLDIAQSVGDQHQRDLVSDIRRELEIRQSFHVFEMNAVSSRQELKSLRDALVNLGLFSHPLPRILFWMNYTLGRKAIPVYRMCRRILQRQPADRPTVH